MSDSARIAALEGWEAVLGKEAVLADAPELQPYEANVSGLSRSIGAVLRPTTTVQVQQIVAVAREHRVPLYPISTGKNWGMGSRLPVENGNVVVDLSGMKRIRELNIEHAYAVVEPGVSQQQLHEEIRKSGAPLMLNVIGSSKDTSLIGNALDRGVGYFDKRVDTLSGIEVVLGNGKITTTGFGHYDQAATTHLYRFGIGPSLDGLFAQSNYGIVTAAGISLMHRPAVQATMIASITDAARLPDLVDALARLRRNGSVTTIVHIANQARSEISITPVIANNLVAQGMSRADARQEALKIFHGGGFGAWSAVTGLMGTDAQVRVARREIARELKGIAKLTILTADRLASLSRIAKRFSCFSAFRRRLALAQAIQPFFGLTQGIPTDAALDSVYWPLEDEAPASGNPDHGRSGLLYCLPYIPLSGTAAARTAQLCETIFGRYGFTPYTTLNVADVRSMEVVINLAFRRDDAQEAERAHACVQDLQDAYMREGWYPYRIGIQSMHQIMNPDDTFWQTVRDLKSVLDPDHIIAPGRYNLC